MTELFLFSIFYYNSFIVSVTAIFLIRLDGEYTAAIQDMATIKSITEIAETGSDHISPQCAVTSRPYRSLCKGTPNAHPAIQPHTAYVTASAVTIFVS